MIQAKFRVQEVVENRWNKPKVEGGEPEKYQEAVRMAPVYSPDPESQNHAFWKATPSGEIRMWIDNPEAWGQLKEGQEYILTFEPASE